MVGVFSSGLAVIDGSAGGVGVVLEGGNWLGGGVFLSDLGERGGEAEF